MRGAGLVPEPFPARSQGRLAAPQRQAGTAPFGAPSRAGLARSRILVARQALTRCELCLHRCGVDRLAGELGRCRAGSEPRCFLAQTEVSDEMELIPTFAIALSGCDLRCAFCITGAQSWNPRAGEVLDAETLARRAAAAWESGARTIMILGGEPTIHLPAVLALVAALPDGAPLVWKTNGHASAPARALLDSLFDYWVVDVKFGNDACAWRLARVPDYGSRIRENLVWARNHSHLIVRHLLLPGHVECCWQPIAVWLASRLPGVKVSLPAGFWPAWHSARHPELDRPLPRSEWQRGRDIARAFGLHLVE